MRRTILIFLACLLCFSAGYCHSENNRPTCTFTQAAKDKLFKR